MSLWHKSDLPLGSQSPISGTAKSAAVTDIGRLYRKVEAALAKLPRRPTFTPPSAGNVISERVGTLPRE
jgi:hypothetical protein